MNQKSRLMYLLCSPALLGGVAHGQPMGEVPGGDLAPGFERAAPSLPERASEAAIQPELRLLINNYGRAAGDEPGATTWRLNAQQRAELREQLRSQSQQFVPARRASSTRP